MEKYRIEKIGFSWYVQKWGLVMLDGCPDYMWKNLARYETEEQAQNDLKERQNRG